MTQYKPVKGKGFSLIELMIVLSIIGMASSIALPAFSAIVADMQIRNALNILHNTLKLARNEAVIRNKTVRICASDDGDRCNGKRNMAAGWIVYVDESKQKYRTQKDQLVQVQGKLTGLDIRYNRATEVRFNRRGRIGLNGSITVCSNHSETQPVRLVLIHSGRIRVTANDAKCVV